MIIKIPWDLRKPTAKSMGHWINTDLESQSLAEDKLSGNMLCENSPGNKMYIFSTLTRQWGKGKEWLQKSKKDDQMILLRPWLGAHLGK